MSSTPASPATAWAASAIWSGVGEVKTCPGQAASSMPWPTKPACSGSCPLPPPEMRATLPGVSAARRTNFRSAPSATISACAAAKPSRLSWSTVAGALISFFMASSLAEPLHRSVSMVAQQPGEAVDEFGDQRLKLSIAVVAAQIGQQDRMGAHPAPFMRDLAPARMGTMVELEKVPLVLGREMADLEDRLQMALRDRHRIGGIGDLRDEAAVLAERDGQPLPRAGRPVVEHLLQDGLVRRDGLVAARAGAGVIHDLPAPGEPPP